MIRQSQIIATIVLLAAAYCNLAQGQATTILQIDLENYVTYHADTSDFSKFASIPGITIANGPKNFGPTLGIW